MLVIYRPDSEQASLVDDFLREFHRRYPVAKIETLNIDSREGIATASLYDILSQPGIIAMRDDGSVLASWQGDMLPLIDEVAGYALSSTSLAPGTTEV